MSNSYLTGVVFSKPNVYLIPTIKMLIFVKLQTEVLTDSIQAQLSHSHPVRPAMTVSLRIAGLGFYFRYEPTQLADTWGPRKRQIAVLRLVTKFAVQGQGVCRLPCGVCVPYLQHWVGDEVVRRGSVRYCRPFPAGAKEQILVPNLLLTMRFGQLILLLQTPCSIIPRKSDSIIPKVLSISYMLGIGLP